MISLRRSALLVAVVLFVLGAFLAGTVQTKAANRGVLLIFLPGFNTDSTMPFPFGKILLLFREKDPDVVAFSYSYRGLNQAYSRADTVLQSLNDDVNALTSYLTPTSIKDRDVYLIGHSLGGVIAAKYASEFSGFPPGSNARLASVILLDSPVNGVDQDASGATCYHQFLKFLLDALIGLSGGRHNVPILNELTPGNTVIDGIQTAGNKVPVLSIASKDDCFIPPFDTFISSGENAHVTSGGINIATHGAVLNDANTLDIINHWRARSHGVNHSPQPILTTDCGHLATPWVALYQYANFKGRELCFEGTGVMNLLDFEFDNQTMSINIAANGAFFDDMNGRGKRLDFYYGDEQADIGTVWDNRIESFFERSHLRYFSVSGRVQSDQKRGVWGGRKLGFPKRMRWDTFIAMMLLQAQNAAFWEGATHAHGKQKAEGMKNYTGRGHFQSQTTSSPYGTDYSSRDESIR